MSKNDMIPVIQVGLPAAAPKMVEWVEPVVYLIAHRDYRAQHSSNLGMDSSGPVKMTTRRQQQMTRLDRLGQVQR